MRQKTKKLIWFQLFLLFGTYICNLIADAYEFDLTMKEAINFDYGTKFNTCYYLADFMYMTQQWIFAVSYLRIAVVFKLVFSLQSEKVVKELNRRFAQCLVLAIIVFLLTILPFLIMIFSEKVAELYSYFFIAGLWSVTIVLSFGILRIRKFSKMLVQNKIFANETLMRIHLICFFFQSLL